MQSSPLHLSPVSTLQTGEYATDEEEEMSPVFPNSIEVFDLAEKQDTLSPVELDPEKLAHKFKEVRQIFDPIGCWNERFDWFPSLVCVCVCLFSKPIVPFVFVVVLHLQLQIKHAVTQAEIQLLKRKVRMFCLFSVCGTETQCIISII